MFLGEEMRSVKSVAEIRKDLLDFNFTSYDDYTIFINCIEFKNSDARAFFWLFSDNDKQIKIVTKEDEKEYYIYIVD